MDPGTTRTLLEVVLPVLIVVVIIAAAIKLFFDK